jgi:hypothetical protein
MVGERRSCGTRLESCGDEATSEVAVGLDRNAGQPLSAAHWRRDGGLQHRRGAFSTALQLAERALGTLVEANAPGARASGRNGGRVIPA